MKVAITVWNSRISPVFDVATRALLIDLENGNETGRIEIGMTDVYPSLRVQRLRSQGVDLLICGAVSNSTAALIESAGIELIPWVSGEANEVLNAFKDGNLMSPRFVMPGCKMQMRRRCHGAKRVTGGLPAGGRRRNRHGFENRETGMGMWMGNRVKHDEKEDE